MLFSRLDSKIAKETGVRQTINDWQRGIEFNDEKMALQELAWLSTKSFLKEFALVRIQPSLNDDIPF